MNSKPRSFHRRIVLKSLPSSHCWSEGHVISPRNRGVAVTVCCSSFTPATKVYHRPILKGGDTFAVSDDQLAKLGLSGSAWHVRTTPLVPSILNRPHSSDYVGQHLAMCFPGDLNSVRVLWIFSVGFSCSIENHMGQSMQRKFNTINVTSDKSTANAHFLHGRYEVEGYSRSRNKGRNGSENLGCGTVYAFYSLFIRKS